MVSASAVAAGGADAVNNLEQVLLAAPQAGMWTIRVRGSAVNDGPQGYALVVTGEVADSLCPSDFDFSGATDSDDIVGFFTGAMTMTPYQHWRWTHAMHHGSSGRKPTTQ